MQGTRVRALDSGSGTEVLVLDVNPQSLVGLVEGGESRVSSSVHTRGLQHLWMTVASAAPLACHLHLSTHGFTELRGPGLRKFAFSPLSEEEEEDEQKEPMLKESFEGMKMRSTKQEPNGNSKLNKAQEDDLKWVEENVPSSVTDVALPALLDSDEERMITHFERSKME
ncbi:hypothetical protein J1605_015062 [Eschrichtius robustus]|uniref:Uncharacterized protein n=1 Tax=Eschrichtius robustus TaxID=9764 RepID=A0AB34GD65_ESCRO|nr:hypothetical protein J1605_015062 [Eschrichtius robustus]